MAKVSWNHLLLLFAPFNGNERQTIRADYTFIIFQNSCCQDKGYDPRTFSIPFSLVFFSF